ncbi:MAG: undecaprenyldiphospho-muramoylpentapeptide beta-N-acetylglucosaminyltransferase [Anaerovoracaceae bacterium]
MRVIITGGGTGGHIYPAIAIADKIMMREPDSEILFIGSERGMEKSIVPSAGYNIKYLDVQGINRKKWLKNFEVVYKYSKAKIAVKNIIEDFNPDAVIGTGGYVSAPVISKAADLKYLTFIQEQNAYPGLTNKSLEKKVKKVFLGFETAAKYFEDLNKMVYSGNPVRKDFLNFNRDNFRKLNKIRQKDFVILGYGGSQGAARINREFLEIIKEYNGKKNVKVYFATGKNYYSSTLSELSEMGVDLRGNVVIKEYFEDMSSILKITDLAICRSGALTVSEVATAGVPSILIPSPNVSGNHQYFNALALAQKKATILIEEKELGEGRILKEIRELINSPEKVKLIRENVLKVFNNNATDVIYEVIRWEIDNGRK